MLDYVVVRLSYSSDLDEKTNSDTVIIKHYRSEVKQRLLVSLCPCLHTVMSLAAFRQTTALYEKVQPPLSFQ